MAQERARLARELHDSVGHALNVVVLHAGAAQRLVKPNRELVPDRWQSIETAGRQALGDIERMLGILRAPEEQVRSTWRPDGQLEKLCAQVREAGLPVQLTVEGKARPLPSSLDLTAYRIVQESLTNTLKQPANGADVRCGTSNSLAIEVLDEGRACPGRSAPAAAGGCSACASASQIPRRAKAGPRPKADSACAAPAAAGGANAGVRRGERSPPPKRSAMTVRLVLVDDEQIVRWGCA